MHKYLFSKRFLTLSVITIFLFSIPLLLIYGNFSDTLWIGFRSWKNFAFTLLFYTLAISIMTLSKVFIYKYQSRHKLTLVKFIIWAFVEYLVLAFIYLLLTPAATGHVLQISPALVLKASLCVTLILGLPYSFLCLGASNIALREEFDAFKAGVSAKENKDSITLYDYKGVPALTLRTDAILYMESQDNYVMIHYLSEGVEHKYMLRCPTQRIDAMLEGTSLMRCHRSFIVNLSHTAEIVRAHRR
ncbi:MAG: LytTR family transcriptional regulator DNA-binding domain-containing protein, partial [Candidatus Cryptobacteroides sp.]